MKCLGVDIGSSSIKIAEAESSGRSVVVTNVWEMPLSTDPGRDQTVEIIEKLRSFSSQYLASVSKQSDVRWVIGVPQKSLSSRLRRFPFADRVKILKSLPFELEEDIPFDPSETIFDARVIETFSNGSDVLAVASPHAPIEKALQQAKDGGFEAHIVAAEGLALSNVLDRWWEAPPTSSLPAPLGEEASRAQDVQAAQAILQIGHTQANLIVFREGKVVATRSIPWGGHDVALAIETTFKIPYIEAIKVLQTKSFVLLNTDGVSRDQLAMHRAVADAATPLLRELKTTILDLKTSAGADIQSLLLTGGASQIQNFGPWLTQALEVNANPLNYFSSLQASGRVQLRLQQSPEIENAGATAIGLALEGHRKTRNPAINLLKGPFVQQNENLKMLWDTWGTTMQVALGIFLVFSVYSVMREDFSLVLVDESDALLTKAAQQVAGLRGSSATPDGIQRYITTETRAIKNRETLAQLDEYASAMDFVVRMAEKFPVQLPPREGRGLEVDHIALDNDDLVIEGRVLGPDLAAAVEKELQSIARKGTAKKGTPTNLRAGAPGQPFAFSMKIDRKPEN